MTQRYVGKGGVPIVHSFLQSVFCMLLHLELLYLIRTRHIRFTEITCDVHAKKHRTGHSKQIHCLKYYNRVVSYKHKNSDRFYLRKVLEYWKNDRSVLGENTVLLRDISDSRTSRLRAGRCSIF